MGITKQALDGASALGALDLEVARLKAKRRFRIMDTKSERIYLFRYDANELNLYLIINGKEYKVNNPGSALYAFADQKSYFELLICQPGKDILPIYFMQNMIVLDN